MILPVVTYVRFVEADEISSRLFPLGERYYVKTATYSLERVIVAAEARAEAACVGSADPCGGGSTNIGHLPARLCGVSHADSPAPGSFAFRFPASSA